MGYGGGESEAGWGRQGCVTARQAGEDKAV